VADRVHWEHDGKLMCGASLDVPDDRFLLDYRWVKHVTCEICIDRAKLKTAREEAERVR
jgi:hypothetical protein